MANTRTGEDFLDREAKTSKKKKKDTRYNPWGRGSANPENMSGSTGP